MSIRITEIEAQKLESPANSGSAEYGTSRAENGLEPKVFKVAGTLHLKDALLLENICREVSDKTRRLLVIELSDICFIDGPSAQVLCRMKSQQGIEIRGMKLFIQKVIELADHSD